MANQEDADKAWEKALLDHPELREDDVANDLLTFARQMFGAMPGRSVRLGDHGEVVVEFKVTYPFPLPGDVHTIGCSFVLDPRILARGGEGAAMRVEQDVQRQILTHLLPLLDQKAVDLGGNSAGRKVAAIREYLSNFRDYGTTSERALISRILAVIDS